MAGHWHALVVSPPCNTFSRAVWSNRCGPRPVRDRENPRGYPWLTGALKRKCEEANALVDLALEAARLGQASSARTAW
eukprot:14650279-Alexandrium_andersonii.AAC.1